MEDTIPALADAIYREKVLRARKQTPAEKMEIGIELFENVTATIRSGIRHQFPEAGDDEVESIFAQRMRRLRQVQEHGLCRKMIDQISTES